MKKVLSVFLAVIMIVSVFSASFTVFADHEEDGIYYDEYNNAMYYKGGVLQKGWIKAIEENIHYDDNGDPYTVDEPVWYYADDDGFLVTGWKTIKGKKYYFSEYYYEMYTGMWEIDGSNYYFAESGALQKGWIVITRNEDWGTYTATYYSDPSTGVLAHGWKTVDGKNYCFGDPEYDWDYDMITGVKQIGGKWYYFDDNGVNKRNGWIKDVEDYGDWSSTSWYYADANGVLAQGWKKFSGKWYYFRNEKDTWPNMVSGTYEEIGGKKYLFDANGVMQSGGWIKLTEKYSDGTTWTTWYYADKDGVLKEGWFKSGGKWYYLAPEMISGCGYKVDKKVYVFDKSGVLASSTGWYKISFNSDGKTYTEWYYLTKGGVAKVGWQKISGAWYYFDDFSGYMYSGSGYKIGEKTYVFDKSGKLTSKTGWVGIKSFDGKSTYWFYVTKGGIAKTGWQKISNKWYYFNEESGAMATGIYTVYKDNEDNINDTYFFNDNGVWDSKKAGWASESRYTWRPDGEKTYTAWFYFANGKAITGWKKLSGKWYCFNESDGEMYANGSYYIGDKFYKFDKNGVCLNP